MVPRTINKSFVQTSKGVQTSKDHTSSIVPPGRHVARAAAYPSCFDPTSIWRLRTPPWGNFKHAGSLEADMAGMHITYTIFKRGNYRR